MSERIKSGMIVKDHNGREGVTVPDFMNCCTSDETPIVWNESSGFCGTSTSELTIIEPEDPIPEFKGCGGGRGADCCIFMTVSGKGFRCERHTSMRYDLIFRKDKMSAQREPTEKYPACKKNWA